jgi:protein tyrosine/serine phosphatase
MSVRSLSIAMIATLALACSGYWLALTITGNFHAVVPGSVYRSAQPSEAALGRYVKDHGIRSVLNLRGAQPGKQWYDSEAAMSQRLGLTHIDFAMADDKPLSWSDTFSLISLMREAPKPMLIHCRSGSNRTSLAAAIYLAAIAGDTFADAESQLSPRYGYVTLPFLENHAMRESFASLHTVIAMHRALASIEVIARGL